MRRPGAPSVAVLALSALALTAAGGERESTTLVFERLNKTYTDLAGDVSEIRNGPVTVVPSSESNRLTLKGHRLRLTPLGDGEHRARAWVHFEGEAEVAAELQVAGLSSGRLEDEVVVPDQERSLDARIKLETREGGYLITYLSGPPKFEITIESQLAGQIVSFCETVTRFTLGGDCDGLETALDNPALPMPDEGDVFELDSAELTDDERAQIDAYLARSDQSGR